LRAFGDFADVIESVKDKGVVASEASPDDVEAANKERPNFFQVKNVLLIDTSGTKKERTGYVFTPLLHLQRLKDCFSDSIAF